MSVNLLTEKKKEPSEQSSCSERFLSQDDSDCSFSFLRSLSLSLSHTHTHSRPHSLHFCLRPLLSNTHVPFSSTSLRILPFPHALTSLLFCTHLISLVLESWQQRGSVRWLLCCIYFPHNTRKHSSAVIATERNFFHHKHKEIMRYLQEPLQEERISVILFFL